MAAIFLIKICVYDIAYTKKYIKKSYSCIGLILLHCVEKVYGQMPVKFQGHTMPATWPNPRWPPFVGKICVQGVSIPLPPSTAGLGSDIPKPIHFHDPTSIPD